MRKIAFTVVMFVTFATVANAVTMYAPNSLARPYPFQSSDELVRFDSSDPAGFTVIGSMNVPNISFGGMDFDREGNLWAYAATNKSTGGAVGGLYRVNTATGGATKVGNATQSLDDIAFNPVDNQMYGIRSQVNTTRLYRINLTTGGTSLVGSFTGLPTDVQRTIGFGIDSAGNYYVHDNNVDKIYKGTGLALSELYTIPQDTGYSQGLTIDWSRNNLGYHASVGQGVFPNYFSQINTFASDGSAYTLGPDFGPNDMYDGYGFPKVEPGDIAIVPVPEPASLLLLLMGALVRRR